MPHCNKCGEEFSTNAVCPKCNTGPGTAAVDTQQPPAANLQELAPFPAGLAAFLAAAAVGVACAIIVLVLTKGKGNPQFYCIFATVMTYGIVYRACSQGKTTEQDRSVIVAEETLERQMRADESQANSPAAEEATGEEEDMAESAGPPGSIGRQVAGTFVLTHEEMAELRKSPHSVSNAIEMTSDAATIQEPWWFVIGRDSAIAVCWWRDIIWSFKKEHLTVHKRQILLQLDDGRFARFQCSYLLLAWKATSADEYQELLKKLRVKHPWDKALMFEMLAKHKDIQPLLTWRLPFGSISAVIQELMARNGVADFSKLGKGGAKILQKILVDLSNSEDPVVQDFAGQLAQCWLARYRRHFKTALALFILLGVPCLAALLISLPWMNTPAGEVPRTISPLFFVGTFGSILVALPTLVGVIGTYIFRGMLENCSTGIEAKLYARRRRTFH